MLMILCKMGRKWRAGPGASGGGTICPAGRDPGQAISEWNLQLHLQVTARV